MATSCVYQVSHACRGRVINEQAYTQKVNLRTCEFKKGWYLLIAHSLKQVLYERMERAQISKRPECEDEERQSVKSSKSVLCTDRQS